MEHLPSDWPWVHDGQVPTTALGSPHPTPVLWLCPCREGLVPVFSSFQRLCPSHHELLACPGHGYWPCPMRRSNPGRVGTLISKGKTYISLRRGAK